MTRSPVKRVVLLPPAEPSPWWTALTRALAGRPDVAPLWVAPVPPVDARVPWLSIDGASAAPAGPAPAPPAGAPATSLVLLDVRSPRTVEVAPIGRQVPLVVVVEREADLEAAALEAIVAEGQVRLVVCGDVAVARALPGPLRPLARVVPVGVRGLPEPPAPARGVPTVALLGGAMTDEVRLAWAKVAQRWPDAVLVADTDGLDEASRARLLQQVHIVVVLDSAGDRLAEAMASGATVVAHGDAYAASLIEHAVHGLLTDARASDLLAATLVYAIEYHEQLAPLRAAARERARTSLSAASLAERLFAACSEATAAAAGGRPSVPAPAVVRVDAGLAAG